MRFIMRNHRWLYMRFLRMLEWKPNQTSEYQTEDVIMCVFRVTCVSGRAPGLIDSWSNPVLRHYFPSKQHVDQQHLLRSVHWSRVLSLMHWRCFLKPRSRAWSWGGSSCMCCTHAGSCMGSFTLNPARNPKLTTVSPLTWPANLDCRWGSLCCC